MTLAQRISKAIISDDFLLKAKDKLRELKCNDNEKRKNEIIIIVLSNRIKRAKDLNLSMQIILEMLGAKNALSQLMLSRIEKLLGQIQRVFRSLHEMID